WQAPPAQDRIFGGRISLQNGAIDGGRDDPLRAREREPPVNRIAIGTAFAGISPFCRSGGGSIPGSRSLLTYRKSNASADLTVFRLGNLPTSQSSCLMLIWSCLPKTPHALFRHACSQPLVKLSNQGE